MRESEHRRALALMGFAFGAFALVAQAWFSIGGSMESGLNGLQATVRFISHGSILANGGIVLVYLGAVLKGHRWLSPFRKPFTRSLLGAGITLVTLHYYFTFSDAAPLETMARIADYTLHYVCPAIYVIWLAAHNRTGTLRVSQAFSMLVPALIYIAYILMRGEVTADYPYQLLNARELGYSAVAQTVALAGLVLLALNVAFVAIDRAVLVGVAPKEN